MSTSTLFNNFNSGIEQSLIEDLIIESIKIYGIDVYYLPLTIESKDLIFREETQADFNSAFPIEMYIKNTDRFEGEGDFLSKFGLEIRDKTTFTVAIERIKHMRSTTGQSVVSGFRPKEGDLIWFPLPKKLFKISFVEHEAIFYQLGKLQTYDLTCELLEYNNISDPTSL